MFTKEDFTMSFVEVIKTFFEFAAVVLLIVGFINEKKVIAFEQKLFKAIRIHLRNHRIRKQREAARARASVQRRAPEDVYDEEPVFTVVEGGKSAGRVA